ncbi:MAG TPA: hypothetical protein VGR19_12295 [Allosphingosinicella sp.]|nr:hypothetical protein [Allosphingosinicella sp.]
MRILPFPVLLLALAACGKSDPATPEGSASAQEINAAVAQAQRTAVNAQMDARGMPDTPQAREKVAKNVLGEANTSAGKAAGAAARQGRPTTVDPSLGDPLPAQPR